MNWFFHLFNYLARRWSAAAQYAFDAGYAKGSTDGWYEGYAARISFEEDMGVRCPKTKALIRHADETQ